MRYSAIQNSATNRDHAVSSARSQQCFIIDPIRSHASVMPRSRRQPPRTHRQACATQINPCTTRNQYSHAQQTHFTACTAHAPRTYDVPPHIMAKGVRNAHTSAVSPRTSICAAKERLSSSSAGICFAAFSMEALAASSTGFSTTSAMKDTAADMLKVVECRV